MYKYFFKQFLDFFTALIGLLLLSPIFISVTVLLFISNQGRPFFFQKRPGKDEKLFSIIKFKTMTDVTDKSGNLLPDEKRLTAVGKFVRKTSLDEIPQLLNVIKGDMSLVGPRPLRIHYLTLYNAVQKKRHEVRPGITGLVQVSGRNNLNWDDRLELGVQYVENMSLSSDMKILIKAIKGVISRKDVLTIPGNKFTTLDKFRSK